ncbi:MAG: cysteine desulfurase [Planctomycetes bacterium]|nr:cysteine desulfurase [Planctomycetota bacterium]
MAPAPRIYLDHAATTPLAPEVLAAMTPFLTSRYGNPSSLHTAGREARIAVEAARERVAEALGAKPGEIVFTSGGTEGDSLAILGAARGRAGSLGADRGGTHTNEESGMRNDEGRGKKDDGRGTTDEGRRMRDEGRETTDEGRRTKGEGRGVRSDERKKGKGRPTAMDGAGEAEMAGPHVIATSIEHHAVLHCCDQLRREEFEVALVPPAADGVVSADAIAARLGPGTLLLSVMHTNNETGVIQPVEEIGRRLRARSGAARPSPPPRGMGEGPLFHVDAVQSFGKRPVDVNALGCDLAVISAHKINGPKGVGALYIREGTPIEPRQFGGGSEFGIRPGTENVAGIVGLAAAVDLTLARLAEAAPRTAALRDRLETGLRERLPDLRVNGAGAPRICNVLNCTIPGVDGEVLLLRLDARGVAVSTGAACSAGDTEPSHVLLAMGLSRELARASLRFSLGPENTMEEVDRAIGAVTEEVGRLRGE